MTQDYDAIIIGAGVIGACLAFELSKAGWKTLNVDRLPAAGYGSTSASCAIIRPYYSALETCAMAYEGWFYWDDWPGYVESEDPRGMIQYHNTGCLVLKTEHNRHLAHICAIMDQIGCPYEHLTPQQMKAKLPIMDTRQFGPAKRPDDEDFGEATGESVDGGVVFERGGYVSDPAQAARNAEHAAKTKGSG